MSPTPEKLVELIQYAKSKKLRVVLMPIVLLEHPSGNEWRGTIKPESWDDWSDSYREMIHHYETVAEAGHVEVFLVGSELVSTERYREEWPRTIPSPQGNTTASSAIRPTGTITRRFHSGTISI